MPINSKYLTEITKDTDLLAAGTNFSTNCNTSKIVLGLGIPDLAEIGTAQADFQTQYTAYVAARTALENARTAKETSKANTKAIYNKWAKVFNAKTTVPDAILASLMLPPHHPVRTKTAPTPVLDLVATSDSQGNVLLRWHRNGNTPATNFIVEYQTSPNGPWAALGATLKAKYTTSAVPGSFVGFRVVAQRNDQSAPASAPAFLWVNGDQNQAPLQIAA